MRFSSILVDSYVFIRKNGVIIGLYVDDLIILIFKRHLKKMIDIKKQLSSFFKIKELDLIKRVLNIRIERFRSQYKIYLN